MPARHVTIQTQAGGANVTLPAATMRGPQPVFKPEDVADTSRLVRLLNQLVRWIVETIGPANSNPMNQGVLLRNVSLSLVGTNVPHGLGRAVQGWMVVKSSAPATYYQGTVPSGVDERTYVTIVPSANVTADLFIF